MSQVQVQAKSNLISAVYLGLRTWLASGEKPKPKSWQSKRLNGPDCSSNETAMRQYIRDTFISMPTEICLQLPPELISSQKDLLHTELKDSCVVDALQLPTVDGEHRKNIAIWQGDMSKLACDAVVNPANTALLGCFLPSHKCLDNILHAQAGPELRIACHHMLRQLNIQEDTEGQCRVTEAFALPSKYVFHTVGPCLCDVYRPGSPSRAPNAEDRAKLKSCYVQCLKMASEMNLSSIAFCCISTGIFGYPAEEAAEIALQTVQEECMKIEKVKPAPKVIFNVFKDEDLAIYKKLTL